MSILPHDAGARPSIPERHPVLITIHADGFVEVFGDRNKVTAHTVVVPKMQSSAGESLAEEYIEAVLPRRYRDIYFPGNLLGRDMVTTITPGMISNRRWDLAVARGLDEIRHNMRALS
jgi:hypothetical protein